MINRTQMNPENEKVAKSMQNVYFKLIRIKYAKSIFSENGVRTADVRKNWMTHVNDHI